MQSPSLARLLGFVITGLLTANALVIGAGVVSGSAPATASQATGTASTPAAAVWTPAVVITRSDGTTETIDPTTPSGIEAIAAAKERGDEMTLTTVQVSAPTAGTPSATSFELDDDTATGVGAQHEVATDGAAASTTSTATFEAIIGDVEEQTGVVLEVPTTTTPPTTPPTTTPPTTTTVTTETTLLPQITVPPVTVPPVTVPPVTVPPVTVPPVTAPPVTVPRI